MEEIGVGERGYKGSAHVLPCMSRRRLLSVPVSVTFLVIVACTAQAHRQSDQMAAAREASTAQNEAVHGAFGDVEGGTQAEVKGMEEGRKGRRI
eukprot:729760-Rhodomonas_salina.2